MQKFPLYRPILSFRATNDITRIMQLIKGRRPAESDVVFTTGGLSDPKAGVVPDAGLLEFNTEGGLAGDSLILAGSERRQQADGAMGGHFGSSVFLE